MGGRISDSRLQIHAGQWDFPLSNPNRCFSPRGFFNYPGPSDRTPKPLIASSKTQPSNDVIVVGSGAAGGQTAYTCAMNGARS